MSVIAPKISGAYATLVRHRPLFAILIAAALLFPSLAPYGGAAMATTPADRHTQMTERGHCSDQPAKGDDHKVSDKSCCVTMCIAMAVIPSASFEPRSLTASVDRPLLSQLHHSFVAKLPTPPPRRA